MENIEHNTLDPKNQIIFDTQNEFGFGEVCKQIPQSELANLTKILNKNLSIDV